jgi:hypothetical protein
VYPPAGYAQPGYGQNPYASHHPYAYPAAQPQYGQAQYPQPPGYPPGYPPVAKRKPPTGLWVGLGAVAVAIVLLICGSGIAALDKLGRSVQNAGSGQPYPLPTSDGADLGDPPHPDAIAGIGEPVRSADYEFTVLAQPSCKTRPIGQAGKQVTPKKGQFCSARIRVTNHDGPYQVTWLALGAAAYTTYEPDYRTLISTEGMKASGDVPWAVLKPGEAATVTAVFDLETGDTIEYLELGDSTSTVEPVIVEM